MIKLCFFARFREKLGLAEESLPLQHALHGACQLKEAVVARHEAAIVLTFCAPRGPQPYEPLELHLRRLVV